MVQTIIATRITVSEPITETGYGVTTIRRVATKETIKRLQYSQDAYKTYRNEKGKLVSELYQKEYDYMVIEKISWYQNLDGFPADNKGAIQFGDSQSGITELPEWAK